MLKLLYVLLLSLVVLQILKCEIIEKGNDTLNRNGSSLLENSSNIHLHNDDYTQSFRNHTNDLVSDISINGTNTSNFNIDESMSNPDDKNKQFSRTVNTTIIDTDDMPHIDDTEHKNDDIPTFAEYQQKIEKESKQKRENLNPNSPTSILKDKQIVKGSVEHSISGDNHESLSPPSPTKSQEIKDESEVGHNSRKAEDLKVDLTASVLSKSLMKNNVAAKECGAKILETSRQISHAAFVLNNNKDEYLNVPCSAPDKWFVVETCEPVQIRSIQIANFEMFSSHPKTFKVSTADRYPVKIWYNLGVFRAHDEKGIQTFELSDTRMVKYLRFEMLDHYGQEHYCPLTFVRVMGNVVIDDMDEDNESDQSAFVGQLNESVTDTPSKIQSNGLLTKAKDMIAKIVHGIGGSQKPDSDPVNLKWSDNTDCSKQSSSLTESPCYLLEFLAINYRQQFHSIYTNLYRLQHLVKKDITKDPLKDLQLTISALPFPSQVRVEYFKLYEMIDKTEYHFDRVYQSFANISMYCSQDCWSNDSLDNLRKIYKCTFNYYSNSTSIRVMPTNPSSLKVVPQNIEEESENDKKGNTSILPASHDPVVPIIENNEYAITNSTMSDDLAKIEDDSPEATDPIVTNQMKYKSDEIFDNKMFSNPGNNAWNYAFMRIKNMAKELEVNVSMSMTYLEELSQNYKQQTDKLKKSQTVMAANVTQLENMINQHRQETRLYVKELRIQLQAILLRMKMTSDVHGRMEGSISLNLSKVETGSEEHCASLMAEGLILPSPSLLDSPILVTIINVSLSILCNSVLLMAFYNKIRNRILNDVTKMVASSDNRLLPSVAESSVLLCDDLSPVEVEESFPIVLPPRGVQIFNFPDCDYFSDDECLPRKHKGLGPLFYPVQPTVNFVTPTKNKRKKKRK